MNFHLKTQTLAQACAEKADALLIVSTWPAINGAVSTANAAEMALRLSVAQARKAKDFEDKPGSGLLLYGAPGVASRMVVALPTCSGSGRDVRKTMEKGMSLIKGRSVGKLVVCLTDADAAQHLPTVMQAIADAAYRYSTTLGSAQESAKSKAVSPIDQVFLLVPPMGSEAQAMVHRRFAHGQALVEGMALAKEWANRPANHATPRLLAGAAQALAKKHAQIQCEVLGPKEVEQLKMGSFLSVAQGSVEPLRFIVLQYWGASKKEAPLVLVGKGVTFDTGGISLKPGAGMDEMKFDMCGAAAVLGTFKALALSKPKRNVIGLIPATENMPSGQATKPGDVFTAMDGQTIEVLNTDAEGRLILCDALVYAKRFKPAAVVDVATLTGACGIALGSVRAGLFATHDQLAEDLLDAGERSLDLAWRMPLDDAYAEGLKSNFADVANVADRQGGAVTAAKFLERFAKEFPWAHLDIAGVAWKGGKEKGSTARPIGLLLEWLLGTPNVDYKVNKSAKV